jgi:hypothetical protein
LESKRSGCELDTGKKIPIISQFIESELERWKHSDISGNRAAPHEDCLDEFFRECLVEIWHN